MDHRVKTGIFKFLEKLPKGTGIQLYHFVQKIYNKHTSQESLDDHLSTLTRFELGLNKYNLSFADKTIVEIGSGWLPATPYLLLDKFHARKIITYDIEHHYQSSKIRELNNFFSKTNKLFSANSESLPSEVEYYPNQNIITSPPMEKANVLLSRNVLEHVPKEKIGQIHRQALEYLTDDGVVVHQISPSDHRAYYDKNLSLWDFLKYSKEEWEGIQTVFDYHNRLRLPDYLDIFSDSGYAIVHCDYKSKTERTLLPEIIHEDFSQYSIEELTAGNLFIILKKLSS